MECTLTPRRMPVVIRTICAALAAVGVVSDRTMPVAGTSCLTDDPADCFVSCSGMTPRESSACRVSNWYSSNILARSATQHNREGAYPHVTGDKNSGWDRNVRTGSDPRLNQLHGCNLLRAQECMTYMKNHPPEGCDMTTVVADQQAGCCAAYEPTARCIRDVGCGHHHLITDLFKQCRHHGCVVGCEFSASTRMRPHLILAIVIALLNVAAAGYNK